MTQQDSEQYYVWPEGDRPDFRQVKAFLWSDGANVDSDGDCRYASDRAWKWLYFCTRDAAQEMVNVDWHQEEPLILTVTSSTPCLAARTAYVLALSTQGQVARSSIGPFQEASVLLPELGTDFSVAEALSRFTSSPFARSTPDNPDPNLDRNGPQP